MALTIKEQIVLSRFGEFIAEKLRFDIRNKKITRFGEVNASGNLAESVRFEVYDNGLRIYALDYIFFLEKGRAPTSGGGDGSLKDAIRDWIEVKRITPDDGISKDSLAFLIARKIHAEGTEIYKQGGSDLISSIISEDLVQRLIDEMTGVFLQEMSTDLAEAFDVGTVFASKISS